MPEATEAAFSTDPVQHVDALAQDVGDGASPVATVAPPQTTLPAEESAHFPRPDEPPEPLPPHVDTTSSKSRPAARNAGRHSEFALEGDFESPEAILAAPAAPAQHPPGATAPATTPSPADQWSTESDANAAPVKPTPTPAPTAAPKIDATSAPPTPPQANAPTAPAPAAAAAPLLIARRPNSAPAAPQAAPPTASAPAPTPTTPQPASQTSAPPAAQSSADARPAPRATPRVSLDQRVRPIVSAVARPLSRLSPTVRRILGWLAINSAFLAVCVWLYVMLFR